MRTTSTKMTRRVALMLDKANRVNVTVGGKTQTADITGTTNGAFGVKIPATDLVQIARVSIENGQAMSVKGDAIKGGSVTVSVAGMMDIEIVVH
ncbi:hypothetical protein UFOVP329_51 [uncultured Caudovirales phage]|uniref:Uncharacterized protein n=1 Tax=uncultured Caudovirales phage TaxID=2100421 RepID=A0A6J5M2Y4_9CAUD|nr:hypothetical protein UFOVP329_51 [uncultured Caudovirales phage]